MNPHMRPKSTARRWFHTGWMASVASLFAACRSTPPTAPGVPEAEAPAASLPQGAQTARPSVAATAQAYRQDAAAHLYAQNAARIYKGRLPPMLYAIGVLRVDIDAKGNVVRTTWARAPRHAPEVIKEIERTVRAAVPFPVPTRLGKVTYSDTWLWDKGGKFQLDALTEGQD